jgi:hypothetical protein
MSSIEYYVVRPLSGLSNEYKRGWELTKYNSSRFVTGTGNVYELPSGGFISDDAGFKNHRNELASRRIRIVKKHLDLKEPGFAAYWLSKNNVEYFTP